MTTIAISRVDIAADSALTFGTHRGVSPDPKIVERGGRLFAFAGAAGLQDPLIMWAYAGARLEKLPSGAAKIEGNTDNDWELIMISSPTLMRYWNQLEVHGIGISPPFALGSGGDFARGAMATGASASRAVKIAAELDTATGGEIVVVNLKEYFSRKKGRRRGKK